MVTKSKNITKKLPVYLSVFFLVITGVLILLYAKNGIYRDALTGTEYSHSAAYAKRITDDVKSICLYENNAVDGAKKSKAMGNDFSYLYAKMNIREDVDISIDYTAYNDALDTRLRLLADNINSEHSMLQTYNIERKKYLIQCIEEQLDTSTRRLVAVSNNTDLIHSSFLESNGYKYNKIFNYETGDSAVIVLIYNDKVFSKLKTNWKIFYSFITAITYLAIISAIYLLYVFLSSLSEPSLSVYILFISQRLLLLVFSFI